MIKLRRYGRNQIIEYYDKLKTQPYNKCHKVALITCVNKLLKLLLHLITHNIHHNYQLIALHHSFIHYTIFSPSKK